MKTHEYKAFIDWTCSKGIGTTSYQSYERNYSVRVNGKQQVIHGSADSAFLGDPSRFNPEELFLAALSSCHMLWYLHLCADKGIVVLEYADSASGTMIETPEGGGHFTNVTLQPLVTIADESQIDLAKSLHHEANKKCFIANSCNFPIDHKPTVNFKL
ncbi:MAG: OsmC family protein [Crocinitomicaceae bacterium]